MDIKILQKKAHETAAKCGQLYNPDWPSCLREITKELQEPGDTVFLRQNRDHGIRRD